MYCSQLIPGDSNLCPLCGSADPFHMRCPKCRNPIEGRWKVCSSCGMQLFTPCPSCGQTTRVAKFCGHCNAELLVTCPQKRCGVLQIMPADRKCIKCGKPFK
ncbi:MAG: double zinc ribbon domain-containing protein [Syntrophomonadaceae bacterium]